MYVRHFWPIFSIGLLDGQKTKSNHLLSQLGLGRYVRGQLKMDQVDITVTRVWPVSVLVVVYFNVVLCIRRVRHAFMQVIVLIIMIKMVFIKILETEFVAINLVLYRLVGA